MSKQGRHLNIVQNVETSQQEKLPTYKNFNELKTRIENLKMFQKGWIISNGPNKLRLKISQNRISHLNLKLLLMKVWDFHVMFMNCCCQEDHAL